MTHSDRIERFLKRANETHEGRYDYSKMEYINFQHKITIICPEHGEFKQTPNGHVNNASGCPHCRVGHKIKKIGYIRRKGVPISDTRQCGTCKRVLPIKYFRKDSRVTDGMAVICNECAYRYNHAYRIKNIDKVKKQRSVNGKKEWRKHKIENFDEFIVRAIRRIKKRKENVIRDHLSRRLRQRIREAVAREFRKTCSTDLLGCSIDFFKGYIESKWEEGMSWDNHNYYGWHLDHIKPCAMFDLTDREQQKQCFHYSNYQPLWMKPNQKKGARHDGTDYRKPNK